MSENELGAFLRARREAVTPTEVGLPSGPRRRTPGLRRSEVATLAGISVEYLTRLEQGRDRNPSPSVLGSLADTLRLTVEERVHLRRLEKASNGADNVSGGQAPEFNVTGPEINVGMENRTVQVPDVDVKVPAENAQ